MMAGGLPLKSEPLSHMGWLLDSEEYHPVDKQQPLDAIITVQSPEQTIVHCPKAMVGRVIGKSGETIKALQQYSGAMIQIDQSSDPTRITIAGKEEQVGLATNMVADIVTGHFKGFAMLRQLTTGRGPQMPPGFEHVKLPTPKYMPRYGFVPPQQYTTAADFTRALAQAQGTVLPPIASPPMSPLAKGLALQAQAQQEARLRAMARLANLQGAEEQLAALSLNTQRYLGEDPLLLQSPQHRLPPLSPHFASRSVPQSPRYPSALQRSPSYHAYQQASLQSPAAYPQSPAAYPQSPAAYAAAMQAVAANRWLEASGELDSFSGQATFEQLAAADYMPAPVQTRLRPQSLQFDTAGFNALHYSSDLETLRTTSALQAGEALGQHPSGLGLQGAMDPTRLLGEPPMSPLAVAAQDWPLFGNQAGSHGAMPPSSMVTSQMLSSNQSTHEHQLFGAPLGSSSASLTASDSERKSPKTIGSSDDTSPRDVGAPGDKWPAAGAIRPPSPALKRSNTE